MSASFPVIVTMEIEFETERSLVAVLMVMPSSGLMFIRVEDTKLSTNKQHTLSLFLQKQQIAHRHTIPWVPPREIEEITCDDVAIMSPMVS